jgi:hypothetical protein
LALLRATWSFRARSWRCPDAFWLAAISPADACGSPCAIARAVSEGGGADGDGETVWGALVMYPAGAGGGVIFEISCCPFHMPGCKTTTTARVPNTAAIAPQRRTSERLHRGPAATRTGSAAAASSGSAKAATSRQSAHVAR